MPQKTEAYYRKQIDEAINSFERAWTAMDLNTFGNTANWFSYDPLIANSWTRRMLKMIADLKRTKLNDRQIASLFPNMSELRVKMGFDLWTAKYADVTRAERMEIAKFYVDLLNAYCLEDPYALKKNVVHSPTEVSAMAKKTVGAAPEIAKKLGRLVSACYHFGHAAYSDMYPSIVYENYGPYPLAQKYGPNAILAVKDFNNLRCPELWPETKNFPWMHVSIIYVYNNVRMRVDSASHAIFSGNLITNLKRYSLEVDGKRFPVSKTDQISAALEKMASKLFRKNQSFNLEQKKKKYYYQKAYVYKKIFDYLGQDWRPSPEILNEAKGRPLYEAPWPASNAAQIKLFRQIFDPRISVPKI